MMTNDTNKNAFSAEQTEQLLETLRARFEDHMHRHNGVDWADIAEKLAKSPAKLQTLQAMEDTGGEPDVFVLDNETVFIDAAKESPTGRRSICYDRKALDARKKNKPENSAHDVAADIGIDLLTEEQYRTMQEFGPFDLKTSSWIHTPEAIRNLGGALFCDRRYDHVFLYHNGADSYYGARGFRGMLKL
ncbi:DUF4256 domain-containing protein [Planomicrobium sp. YIM 101495]|uniref:DUF4256 domain-containing protein n=1 Tax=Planomicrobium sp. YIM 101495 TaxID=2665160 RepID=UPI00351A5563